MDTPTFGKKNGLKVSDMRGLAYDDAQWDKILDELTEDDYNQLSTSPASEYMDAVRRDILGDEELERICMKNLQETQEGAGSDY